MLSLQFHRSKAKGVSDLLNHLALVDSGVIQCKDGALLAGFFFRGEDSASATNARRNQISRRVNRALTRLGNEYATFFEAVRFPVQAYPDRDASHFPDDISALVDEARRERALAEHHHFVTEQVLTIKYKPPSKQQNWLTRQFYDGGVKEVSSDLDRHLDTFKKTLKQLQDDLGDVLTMRRMVSYKETDSSGVDHHRDELLNYINVTVCGTARAIDVPPTGMYLDVALGGQELFPGDYSKLGDTYIAAVAIEGFPATTWPGILDVLNHMAIPYRAVYRFIHLEHHTALKLLKRNKLRWEQQIRPFMDQLTKANSGRINADALSMAREISDAETDAQSGMVSFGYATPVVILTDTDLGRLQENARIVAAEIAKEGFNTRVETVNNLQAWLGSLPGHTAENIRRPLLHTLSWADMAPLSSVWPGNEFNPNKEMYPAGSPALFRASTSGYTPFRFNLHVDDLGHTLILGPTGAGKSVLLSYIAMSFRRYPGATITAFDKGGSMMATVLGCGGKHYDLSPDLTTSPKLCPLQYIDEAKEAVKAEEVLETMYELTANEPLTPAQRNAIHEAVVILAQRPEGRSLTNFVLTVQDAKVRDALKYYTGSGGLGEMLDADADAKTDLLANNPFAVFEIEELLNLGPKAVIPVLQVLFSRFERQLRGQPALLILDEAWVMLANPVFRAKIREWLKVLRKNNCAVILATQSLSDVEGSEIADVINESCPTKIFLPNPDADRSRELYEALGLNEKEIEIISEAIRKQDYYVSQPVGRRKIWLDLDPLTLAFVAASSKEDRKTIASMIEQYGDDWRWRWLDHRRVSYRHLLPNRPEVRHAA